MIIIETKLKIKKHIWNNYDNGQFDYSSCRVCYSFKKKNEELEMCISILSKEYNEEICPIFTEIVDFLYLACGTMPYIIYYKENNVEKDLSNLACRYFPSKRFFTNNHLIDINNSTLNENTLINIKNIIRNKPFEIFWAFTSLTSQSYAEIYEEHKITLLLQCFDGYIYNKDIKYQQSAVTFKDRLSIIVNILFEYEKKYNTEILKTLNINENIYLEKLTNTRHQFSHYIIKNNTLNSGEDYIFNFVVLHFIFRIYILREIRLIPKEDNIKEFLNSEYDRINSSKNSGFKDYKSVAYRMKRIFN
ncbi:MAG: hypothetical protein PHW00_03140 [Clostridia bacterium]|nr:hypothetical protein [Clostridia bacterium]